MNNELPSRTPLSRSHSNFAARTATDAEDQLGRTWSMFKPSPSPRDEDEQPSSGFFRRFFQRSNSDERQDARSRITSHHRSASKEPLLDKRKHSRDVKPRLKSTVNQNGPASAKLGTFAGVFVPTTLNVLSILMFLRFGFILGQSGVVGMMGMLIACYAINLLTTMSISAIATNGTVRGGGAYYLLSRSLGPEFGGSIGMVFYLGCVFNTGMNAVGLIDCLRYNFGATSGGWSQWLPDGFWFNYLWATVVLVFCTAVCLAGSGLFARASNGLLVILLIATFSIPISTIFMSPFESKRLGIEYTGLSMETFRGNLMPQFTKGADGSQLKGRENWQDLFGILFPATGGIFAGASMSGDLKHPSKAIPKGTLYGLLMTFFSYTIVILAMGATITRTSFYHNVNVIQDVNVSGVVVLLGEIATSLFSSLMGVIGSAKLLQALARDKLIPGLSIFGQGTKDGDEPTYAIIVTYAVAQLTMLADINQIASFVTMTYLLTFIITNLACFLLTIGSAPNFRPSFHFFNWQTAFFGTLVSAAVMFFVDRLYAAMSVGIMAFIFLLIHYTTPPKSWGDVSQSLIYHQVRKYLLRLRSDHIKFWRPSVLLLVNDPRRQYKLIQFCNSLKKGGLFILGHVIVTQDFPGAVAEAKQQQSNWQKYIDFSKIKAFINISISPGVEWGARNVVLGAGLGGMRPNIVVMGFFNLNDLRHSQPLVDIPTPQPSRPASVRSVEMKTSKDPKSQKTKDPKKRVQKDLETLKGRLPTDINRPEGAIGACSYMTVLEDMVLRLQINVAIGKGFQDLELPSPKPTKAEKALSWLGWKEIDEIDNTKKYIDLWPIQMSAEICAESDDDNDNKKAMLTSNFDTYTLILQLGCILDTVPSWKRAFNIRVCVFVEYESDVEEERGRVTSLLNNLRIRAEVLVFWLASGSLKTYEIIVNGKRGNEYAQALSDVNDTLEDEEWWDDVQKLRGMKGKLNVVEELAEMENILDSTASWPTSSYQHGRQVESNVIKFEGLRKMMRKAKRHASIGTQFRVSMKANSSKLDPELVLSHPAYDSASESASSSDEADSDGSAVSEADADDYNSENKVPKSPIKRSKSVGDSLRPLFVRDKLGKASSSPPGSPKTQPTLPIANIKDPVIPDTPLSDPTTKPQGPRRNVTEASSPRIEPKRPSNLRQQSFPRFTSRPVPATKVATEETELGGRSIMFADGNSPPVKGGPKQSIYGTSSSRPAQPVSDPSSSAASSNATPQSGIPASGFPALGAIPLTFNDLPCRAQHLILNELINQHSSETCTLLTTLPSPVLGTCQSEVESVRYLSDLEVLCQGLPPVLLVHSNSMTVTTNL
ncbi:cation chloride cotransporter-like protein [Venturia nashicola]|uniref:Cation chloride cotransporter-like protein n=1 Tax=Venturia nashicola TaxID=86259 RepID=A0A4Z1PEL1_9PEZI|nr:cation chloride cotransporter-like protein [Venturia nashicola]